MQNGSSQAYWLLLLGLTLLCGQATATEREQLERLAREYIGTLDKDLKQQASFYGNRTRFTDPTSALFGEPWDITGGDNIVRFFREAAADFGTLAADYRIDTLLVEPPFVIAHTTATVSSCGVGLGFPTRVVSGDIQLAMVLKFEGNTITERTDYAGYSAAFEFLEAAKTELATAADDPRCAANAREAN